MCIASEKKDEEMIDIKRGTNVMTKETNPNGF
jgi:hypothetical protein